MADVRVRVDLFARPFGQDGIEGAPKEACNEARSDEDGVTRRFGMMNTACPGTASDSRGVGGLGPAPWKSPAYAKPFRGIEKRWSGFHGMRSVRETIRVEIP